MSAAEQVRLGEDRYGLWQVEGPAGPRAVWAVHIATGYRTVLLEADLTIVEPLAVAS